MTYKDISRPQTLDHLHDDDEGTGIYWFIDSQGKREQIFVPAIKRDRAKELAKDFAKAGKQKLDAYRWVPDQVEKADSLISRPSGGVCTKDIDCVDNACRCIDGRCQRK
jgi:hypothetical protein